MVKGHYPEYVGLRGNSTHSSFETKNLGHKIDEFCNRGYPEDAS